MEKKKHQLALIHSACSALEIDPHSNAVSSSGQECVSVTTKQANRISAYCLARWGWSPVTIVTDPALPRLRKGAWLGTDYVPPVSPTLALSTLYGARPVADLQEAEAILRWAEANPEQLTSGQACRGLEALRAMVQGGDLC